MPVHPTNGGYQWGGHGKVYYGKGARAKAGAQGAAAHAAGYRSKKRRVQTPRRSRSR